MAYAIYAERVLYLDPCPLCMLQRGAFIGMGVGFLLGALHAPKEWGRRIYALVTAAFGLLGAVIAGRHIWMQSLPPSEVPECGPSLSYIADSLSAFEYVREVFDRALNASGNCAEIDWTFLGLSMPWWTLFWYLGLTALALAAGWRYTKRSIFHDDL